MFYLIGVSVFAFLSVDWTRAELTVNTELPQIRPEHGADVVP